MMFGEIKRLLCKDSPDIWEDYESHVNALWTVYKCYVSLQPHNSTQLPGREKGLVSTPGEQLLFNGSKGILLPYLSQALGLMPAM